MNHNYHDCHNCHNHCHEHHHDHHSHIFIHPDGTLHNPDIPLHECKYDHLHELDWPEFINHVNGKDAHSCKKYHHCHEHHCHEHHMHHHDDFHFDYFKPGTPYDFENHGKIIDCHAKPNHIDTRET